MNVVWHDTPDWYVTADLAMIFRRGLVHADAIVSSGTGYDGGDAWSGSTDAAYLIKFEDTEDDKEVSKGVRVQVDALPGSAKVLLGAVEAAGDLQVCVVLNTDGTLSLYSGDMASELAVSTLTITTGVQFALGFTASIDPSNGSAAVYVDDVLFCRVNGVDTAPEPAGNWAGIYMGLGPDIFMSNGYLSWGLDNLRPGYLVDVRRPTTTSASSWTANVTTVTGDIEDVANDGDTSYIYSSSFLAKYAVFCNGMPARARIHGVRTVAIVKNSPSSGSPSYRPLLRKAVGSYVIGNWQSCVQEEYRACAEMYREDPATLAAWITSGVNATAYGGQTET